MKITTEQTEKLLKEKYSFSQLGFSMFLMRLKAQYAKDPSEATLQTCMNEINIFLQKFAAVMSKDLEIINNL